MGGYRIDSRVRCRSVQAEFNSLLTSTMFTVEVENRFIVRCGYGCGGRPYGDTLNADTLK